MSESYNKTEYQSSPMRRFWLTPRYSRVDLMAIAAISAVIQTIFGVVF